MRTLDSCYDDYNEHDDNDYVVVKLMNTKKYLNNILCEDVFLMGSIFEKKILK